MLPSLGLLALTGWLIYERPKAFIPTEDQGYLIVVAPDARRHQPGADQPGRPARRQIAGELHGVRDVLLLDGYNVVTAINQTNTAIAFVMLEEWSPPDRRRSCGPSGLASELQRRLSEQVRDARVAVLQPPPIRG